jgi:L-fuconolactonase
MEIIDTHVHIWDFDRAEYEWLKGDTSLLNRTYSIEEINEERKNAGITGGVLVQAANNAEDTEWMLQVAEKTDWIAGVVGWVPLMDLEATEKALTRKYIIHPYFKGVRHLIHNEADPQWLLQNVVIESLELLAHYNIPYDVVGINTAHLQTAIKVAEKVPGLNMVLDHLNQPPIPTREKYGLWGELFMEAAQHNNLYAKISGLGTTSGNFTGWTAADLEPYIEFTLQHFREDRCFCGGDWPVSLLAGSYTKTWQAYKNIFSRLLNEEAQEKVFSKNAGHFYRL